MRPSERRHAEALEEVAADPQSLRVARLAAGGQIEGRRAPREDVGERLLPIAHLLPQRVGQARAAAGELAGAAADRFGDPDLRRARSASRHRQRAQADRVEQLEDRGVGADAERQRQDRDEREGRDSAAAAARRTAGRATRCRSRSSCSSGRSPRGSASRCPACGAPRRAPSAGLMPRAMLSSVSIARCASSSRARSSSQRSRRRKRATTLQLSDFRRLSRPQDPVHRPHDLVPPIGLRRELFLPRRRQPVVARAAVVLRRAPERRRSSRGPRAGAARGTASRARPAARPRTVLDGVGDGVAVRGADRQRLEDQQVERPLEQFALNRRISAFRHGSAMILH